MANIDRVVELLKCILYPTSESLKIAQKQLYSYQEDQQIINIFLRISLIQGIDQNVAKLALASAKTFTKNYISTNKNIEMNNAITSMFTYLEDSGIPFMWRIMVADNLQFLISMDKHYRIVSAYQPNLISLLNKSMQQNIPELNFQYLALMCKILSHSIFSQTNNPNSGFFEESFIPIVTIAYKLFVFGSTLQNPHTTVYQQFVRLCQIFSDTLKQYMKRFYFYNVRTSQILFQPILSELIMSALKFELPENQISSTIVYWNKKIENKLLKYVYQLKRNYIYILTQSTRILTGITHENAYNHPILTNAPQFISSFVHALNQLLQKTKIFQLASIDLKYQIQQMIQYLCSCLRYGRYYQILHSLKGMIIFGVIIPIMEFSSEDYNKFNHQPEEFFNSLLHTIEQDSEGLLRSKKEQQQNQNEIEDFTSLKSVTANLLKLSCKYIDGTLTEIIEYSLNVLQGKINSEYSSIRIMLVVAIIRDQAQGRQQVKVKLGKFILENIKNLGRPTEEPENMEYSLTLLLLWRYFFQICEYIYNFYEKVFVIIEENLSDHKIDEVPKLVICEIIVSMTEASETRHMVPGILNLLNQILTAKKIYQKYIETIHQIIENNDHQLSKADNTVNTTIQKTGDLLRTMILSRNKKPIIIEHLWNIFEAFAKSYTLLSIYRLQINQSLIPLTKLVDGDSQFDISGRLFMLIGLMIKGMALATQFDLEVIRVLPSVFYKGKQKYRLFECFETLQVLVFYGKQLLAQNKSDLQALLIICLQSITRTSINGSIRSQSDNIQGLLLLQTLIIETQELFTEEIWVKLKDTIIECLVNRQIATDFFLSNLVSTLGLILMYTHPYLTIEENDRILQIILTKYTHYSQNYASKLYILGMGELLTFFDRPYIMNRYQHIFDSMLTLLKVIIAKKNEVFDLNVEQMEYEELKKKVMNRLTQVDEYQFFKSQIDIIRSRNPAILNQVVQNLPDLKKQYLGEIMSSRKVNNEVRKIIRIKNTVKNSNMEKQQ